jgi:predicted oxidoreductase
LTVRVSDSLATQPFGPSNRPIQTGRIALGCMGLAGTWDPAQVGAEQRRRAVAAFVTALDAGVTLYDHADIYGGTACESVFKDCLAAVPGSREKILVATKVGIRLPEGIYDHSAAYIRRSVHASLGRLGLEYVDLYQLHRPDPLSHPAETAEVLDALVAEGLVRMIGVSNYYPWQLEALRRHLKAPIVSNQISFSLLRLGPLYEGEAGEGGDGVLDQCLALGITPLAYSPLGAGLLSGRRQGEADAPHGARVERLLRAMGEMRDRYDGATPTQLSIAWLLKHPAKVIPIVGSNEPAHIREAAGAARIDLAREDWYRLWVASRDSPLP